MNCIISAMLITRKVTVTYLVGREGRKEPFAELEHPEFARTLPGRVQGVGNDINIVIS